MFSFHVLEENLSSIALLQKTRFSRFLLESPLFTINFSVSLSQSLSISPSLILSLSLPQSI